MIVFNGSQSQLKVCVGPLYEYVGVSWPDSIDCIRDTLYLLA